MAFKLFRLLSFAFTVIVASGVLSATVSFAQVDSGASSSATAAGDGAKKKEEEKEVVQTGILASQVNAGLSQSVDVSTDGAAPGETPGVLAANVSVVERGTCVVKVMNNGKKSYSVSYELVAKDYSGNKKFTRFFSSTLRPGKSAEQRTSGCDGKLNLYVDIKSAKPL